MNRCFKVFLFSLFFLYAASGDGFSKSAYLESEAEQAKKMVSSMVYGGITLLDVEYKSGEAFRYTYGVDNKTIPSVNATFLENTLLVQVCQLSYKFVNTLIREKTPMVYIYKSSATGKELATIKLDMNRCKDQ